MKIIQICPYPYEEGSGGVSEYVRNISKLLAKRHDVKVFATDPKGNLPKFEIIDDVEIVRYERWAPGRAFYFSFELINKLRKETCDVVHSHSYTTFPFQVSFLSNYNKLIYTTHFHASSTSSLRNIISTLYNPLGKKILNKADKIIAVSNYEKKILIKRFDLKSMQIDVIPCGIYFHEHIFPQKNVLNKSIKNILYIGRLDDYKGVRYLIEVMPYLDDDITLTLVGSGPLENYLIKRSRKLKILHRVNLLSSLSRKEICYLYKNADLFILLSKHESYSIVIAEALASKVPCIVSNTSALSEWIDNKNCYGVEYPIEIMKLSNLINNLLNKNISIDVSYMINNKIMDWTDVVRNIENVYDMY